MADRFTADKLAWIEQITRDAGLGHYAARVGVIIASHLNRETGEAFPGQERIASLTGASTRQVQRALKELAGRLHVAVEVRHGPNQSSRYRPLIWTENTTPASSIRDQETRHPRRLSNGEMATDTVAKTRHPCRPNPLKEPIEVIRTANDPGEASPLRGPLPDGFPSDAMIDLSHERFLRERLSIDPRLCAEKFRAFYADGSCSNWCSRWETWVLREIEHTRKVSPPPPERPGVTLEQRQVIRARRTRSYADTGVWEAGWGIPPELRDSAVSLSSESVVVSYLDPCDWLASERTVVAPLEITRGRIEELLSLWLKTHGLSVTVAKSGQGPVTDAFIARRKAMLAAMPAAQRLDQ